MKNFTACHQIDGLNIFHNEKLGWGILINDKIHLLGQLDIVVLLRISGKYSTNVEIKDFISAVNAEISDKRETIYQILESFNGFDFEIDLF